jgi:hypothetical protein
MASHAHGTCRWPALFNGNTLTRPVCMHVPLSSESDAYATVFMARDRKRLNVDGCSFVFFSSHTHTHCTFGADAIDQWKRFSGSASCCYTVMQWLLCAATAARRRRVLLYLVAACQQRRDPTTWHIARPLVAPCIDDHLARGPWASP